MDIPTSYKIFGLIGTLGYVFYLFFAYKKDTKKGDITKKDIFLIIAIIAVALIALWTLKEGVTR